MGQYRLLHCSTYLSLTLLACRRSFSLMALCVGSSLAGSAPSSALLFNAKTALVLAFFARINFELNKNVRQKLTIALSACQLCRRRCCYCCCSALSPHLAAPFASLQWRTKMAPNNALRTIVIMAYCATKCWKNCVGIKKKCSCLFVDM